MGTIFTFNKMCFFGTVLFVLIGGCSPAAKASKMEMYFYDWETTSRFPLNREFLVKLAHHKISTTEESTIDDSRNLLLDLEYNLPMNLENMNGRLFLNFSIGNVSDEYLADLDKICSISAAKCSNIDLEFRKRLKNMAVKHSG